MPTPAGRTVELIVAHTRNLVIGRAGGMPWHLPDDLAQFKRATLGRVVIMGRRTFDEIGKPLPGRINLVVTRQSGWESPGTHRCASLDEALALADELIEAGMASGDPAVIGGGQLYRLALPISDRIRRTLIDADIEGDTTFPDLGAAFEVTESQSHPVDDRHAFSFIVEVLERRIR